MAYGGSLWLTNVCSPEKQALVLVHPAALRDLGQRTETASPKVSTHLSVDKDKKNTVGETCLGSHKDETQQAGLYSLAWHVQELLLPSSYA